MTQRPENRYPAYHAHVYCEPRTAAQARALCEAAGKALDVEVGRFHEKLVGPHPRWSCQLAFDAKAFETVIGWLEAHRDGLTVFVHGDTGEDVPDHTERASWLGDPVPLNLEFFDDYRAGD